MILTGVGRVVLDQVVRRAGTFLVVGNGTHVRCSEEAVVKIKELMSLFLALSFEGFGTVRSMYVCKESR